MASQIGLIARVILNDRSAWSLLYALRARRITGRPAC